MKNEIPVVTGYYPKAEEGDVFSSYALLTLLVNMKAVPSMTQAKRLLRQGAIDVDGEKVIYNENSTFCLTAGYQYIIRIGKKTFYWLGISIEDHKAYFKKL